MDFKDGLHRKNFKSLPDNEKVICYTSDDIDKSIKE